jgi:hypothetical protein
MLLFKKYDRILNLYPRKHQGAPTIVLPISYQVQETSRSTKEISAHNLLGWSYLGFLHSLGKKKVKPQLTVA